MFQVEPILWLQAFESPFFNSFMSLISSLGYSIIYGVLIAIITFGINLRKGLAIFMILAIGGIMTDGMKRGFQFPRPSDIDVRINQPGYMPTPKLVDNGGAEDFWALPTKGAMEATKRQIDWSYGFPSGHVSAAVAFMFGLFFLYRKKGLLIFAICWTILMCLSRMYLGRHFLADVIGGVCVGMLAIWIASILLKQLDVEGYIKLDKEAFTRLAYFTVPLVLLVPFIVLLDADNVGRLFGLGVAYFVINKMGHNSDKGTIWKRILRILLSFVLFFPFELFVNFMIDTMGLNEDLRLVMLITTFLLTSLPFIFTVKVSKYLRLYVKDDKL